MQTQWRHVALPLGLGGAALVRLGLVYSSLPVVAQALDARLDAELLAALRVLEDETLAADAEARRKRR